MTCISNLNLPQKQTIKHSIIISLIAFALGGCSQGQPPEVNVEGSTSARATLVSDKQNSQTLANLQKAYDSESNSNVMYLNFALKAHKEGYQDIATLFKSLARAEEIHRDNHAEVIKTMGAIPNSTMIVPQVNSTVDKKVDSTANNLAGLIQGNLGNSINREYSELEMYPKFIKQAKSNNNSAAFKTFKNALGAEKQHAQLFAKANENLDNWRKNTRSFYVCKISGEIFEHQSEAKSCPSNSNGEKMEQINW